MELKYSLAKVKAIFSKYLYLEDDRMVDVVIGAHIANQLPGDPVWLLLIAPPSTTKTEILRSFDGHPKAFFLSNLTPATLISGKNKKEDHKEPSLLWELNSKTVLMKDFTTILTMRSENRQEILSQFREIYDGNYAKSFGTGESKCWKGKIGLIGACTPVYDKHHAVAGALGERFLLYRTSNIDGERMGLQAQKIVGHEKEMRLEIGRTVHKFISQFDKLGNPEFRQDEKINNMIISLATFCSYARCAVDRNYRDQSVTYMPLPEGTARLVKQFHQIGMGIALVQGKQIIDVAVYETIKKIGCDLIPAQRLKVLQHLWNEKVVESTKDWQITKEIADAISLPTNTVKLILEDLMIVKLLNRQRDSDAATAAYKWQFKQDACDMMAGAQVFEVTKDEPF